MTAEHPIPMSETLRSIRSGDLPLDHDWNTVQPNGQNDPRIYRYQDHPYEPTPSQVLRAEITSECMRDGLGGSTVYPSADEMIDYVGMLKELGINRMTVGIYPGPKGPHGENPIDKTIKDLLGKMYMRFPNVIPTVLSMTTDASRLWTYECKQKNPNLEPIVFQGTAPSRLMVENWKIDDVLRKLGDAIEAMSNRGIPVIGATEHTTQTPPDYLEKIILTQINSGAQSICIADTIGCAREIGVYRIVTFVKSILGRRWSHVPIEFHAHDDLGLGVSNALVALAAGANRVHAVARGVGERSGNTRLEGVLAILSQIWSKAGIRDSQTRWNLSVLNDVITMYGAMTKTTNTPFGPFSERAFTTQAGIHASVMNKALEIAEEAARFGETEIAEEMHKRYRTVYTAQDPRRFGREHDIRVGPLSGKSNVILAFRLMGGDPNNLPEQIIRLALDSAKHQNRELSPTELKSMLAPYLST